MIRPPLSRPLALPSLIFSLALGALSGCNPIEENTARPQQAGEPCGETEACGGGLVCSARGICVPFGDPGSAGVGGACEMRIDHVCVKSLQLPRCVAAAMQHTETEGAE